ncbi:MAG: hypothetical protein E5V94_07750, partial [Mesorhizobium sp.]
MNEFTSDVAFTPTVKAIQSRKGSRDSYARVEQRGGWRATITPDLAAFIEAQSSVFLARLDRLDGRCEGDVAG